MTDTTINGLAVTVTPDAADLVGIWDTSAAQFGKCTRTALIGATIVGGATITGTGTFTFSNNPTIQGNLLGGGTIDTGAVYTLTMNNNATIGASITGGGSVITNGFALTVPATGNAALLGVSNIFVRDQNITPNATNLAGLNINMPTGNAAYAIALTYNAAYRGSWYTQSAVSVLDIAPADLGNTVAGPRINIGHNSNGTVTAAGSLNMNARSGTAVALWFDASANLRGNTGAPPTSLASDSGGVVIGTQTSWIELKENIVELGDPSELLDKVLSAKLYSYQFKEETQYRWDGGKPTYQGLIITKEDRENDAWFANNLAPNQTPVLNDRSIYGHLVGSIQAQQIQINALRLEVEQLKAMR